MEISSFIDLFCGIGGFHQAIKRIFPSATCVLASDINKNSAKVYEKNYNVKPEGDVRKIDESSIKSFDILCAGFPCQSFSNAGKKKSFNDTRGTLFHEIIRIARHNKPKFMFLENVKHILKIDNGSVFKTIVQSIEEIGYDVSHCVVSPHQLGVPQQRERVIFVCVRNDISEVDFDISDLLKDSLHQDIDVDRIFEENVDEKYSCPPDIRRALDAWDEIIQHVEVGEKLSPTIMCNEFYKNYTPEEFRNLSQWRQDYITKNKRLYDKYQSFWDTWYVKHKDIMTRREVYAKLEWQVGKKKENDSIWDYFIQVRQSGMRIKKTKYFPTLVAMVQTPIYGKKKRYITPRECARLQSFPDDFILDENDKNAYKQFGNAVNVDVIHLVMKKTMEFYGFTE